MEIPKHRTIKSAPKRGNIPRTLIEKAVKEVRMEHYDEQRQAHAERLRKEQLDRERLRELNKVKSVIEHPLIGVIQEIKDQMIMIRSEIERLKEEIQNDKKEIRGEIEHIKDAIQTLFRFERFTNENK